MSRWSFYDQQTGAFAHVIFSGPDHLVAANTPSGCAAIEGVYDHLSQRVDLATGEVIDWQPPKPGDTPLATYEWDAQAKRWMAVSTLLSVQVQQKVLIDAARVERTHAPIEYAGALFDADDTAIRNVSGWQTQLAAGVALPDGFVWRDATNVDHPADAAFVNGLGAAITLRGTALYAQAWALKAQIDAAETKEAVQAINWDA